jgi:hypothetical protein
MADYSAIMNHLSPEVHETRKGRHLTPAWDTPMENISNKLVAMGVSVISFRQMTASRHQPEGGNQIIKICYF